MLLAYFPVSPSMVISVTILYSPGVSICAPVYSTRHGLATQVDVGLNEGLRHDSSVHCDELVSLRKSQLTQFVGTFDTTKLKCLDDALMVALGLLRS